MKRTYLIFMGLFCAPVLLFASGLVYGEIRAVWALIFYLSVLVIWLLVEGGRILWVLLFSPLVVVLGTLVFIGMGLVGSGINKMYWNFQTKSMCETKGGVKVYEVETISLDEISASRLTGSGAIKLPDERYVNDDDQFYSTFNVSVARKGVPRIHRYEHTVVRVEDEKVLAVAISFSRIGEVFPLFIGNSPSYSCYDPREKDIDLSEIVLKIKE